MLVLFHCFNVKHNSWSILSFILGYKMSDEHIGHKENRLLQRGIFSSSDFAAFQKSEVFDF